MPTVVITGSPGVGRLAGIVFLLIGAGILAVAWHLTRQVQQTVNGNSWTCGVVERVGRSTYLRNSRSGDFPDTTSRYVTLVRFADKQGESHVIEVPASATPPARYSLGDTVTVAYPSAYPDEAAVIAHPGRHHKPVFEWVLGLTFVGIGLACQLLLRRAKS